MTRASAEDITRALANASNEVVIADAERDHWRKAAGLLQAELRVVLGVWMERDKVKRIVITEQEAAKLSRTHKLYVGNPDPGTRQYELREGKEAPMPESRFIIA